MILFEILRHSEKLKDDVNKWKRYPMDHKKKTLGFLTRALDRQIAEDLRDKNAAALQTGRSGRTAAPAAGGKKGVCKGWLKGKCTSNECKKQHPPTLFATQATPAAPADAGNGKDKDKGKGKGKDKGKGKGKDKGAKGKGKDKGRSTSQGSNASSTGKWSHLPCKKYQTRSCPFTADKCRFAHRDGTPAELKEMENIPLSGQGTPRGNGSPSLAKKAMPCTWWVQGNCSYGDNCLFEHDPAKKGSNPSAPAPKARAKSRARSRGKKKQDA